MYGKPPVSLGQVPDAPKKREPRTEAPNIPLEKDVQKAIIDMLLRHPKIGLVERINSGTMQSDNGDGTTRYTQFNKVYGRASNGEYMDMPDVCCTLKGQGRRFVIEVKRPGWKLHSQLTYTDELTQPKPGRKQGMVIAMQVGSKRSRARLTPGLS